MNYKSGLMFPKTLSSKSVCLSFGRLPVVVVIGAVTEPFVNIGAVLLRLDTTRSLLF